MRIAVVALGKIGLPLAVQFASKGHEVIGVDVNAGTVATVNEGREPFPGEAHLAEKLAELVPAGRLRATTDYSEAIPGADAVVLVVPLFVDEETAAPDFGWMDAATRSLAEHLTAGTLVSYETTLPVGTTRNRWKPMLEEISGLVEGEDFHLVFSPERVLTGRVFADLRKYPKLVGGLSPEGAEKAREFYEAVLDFDDRPDLDRPNGVWDLGSAEASELAKLAETTYRDVNIGLANQFALFADRQGIDVHAVIDASNSQPYSHIHRPGIAVGGHCIPVYPRLYLSVDPDASIVREARAVNASMPERVVGRAADLLGSLDGLDAVVLGAAYRGGVKETAFSGVFATVKALEARGASVRVHDPLYSDAELAALGFAPFHLGDEADVVVVQTDHAEYREVGRESVPGARLVVDGRGVTDAGRWAGVPRVVLGRGDAPTRPEPHGRPPARRPDAACRPPDLRIHPLRVDYPARAPSLVSIHPIPEVLHANRRGRRRLRPA
ncbi:nucleotide sugar dehydrogenase [Cellulosimicrobium cellulans]|uniref:Nucleotide sugar dehydrogenase n=1 Tax=Cellulosimicrobium cellulans TaxID=1710 RepID=A0A1Y0HSM4_CELCE|nr:nucleotide sugar dehydrogenase [Cellulosimicrobium cellulans]ARU50516.1 nucleotide sugar dehydrogenase [Cellulosimicrobium cellulans]